MVTIQEINEDIQKEYEFILTVKRKSDGHEIKMAFTKLHEVFDIDFVAQLVQHIRKTEDEKHG